MSTERPGSWMRDHLANERTLLAWARTALALVAVGLGVAKLATVLEIAAIDHPALIGQLPSVLWSKVIGVSLVGVGFFSMLYGTWRTRKWAKEVGGDPPSSTGIWLISIVFMAVALGIGAYIVVG